MRALLAFIGLTMLASATQAEELTIASWNIANLAEGPGKSLRGYVRTAKDYDELAEIIARINPDVIALQEIGSVPAAKRILANAYHVIFENRCYEQTDAKCQRDTDDIYTAIAYKTELADRIEPFQIAELAVDHKNECGQVRPVRGAVGIKLVYGGTRYWIPSFHLKASCKDDEIEPDTADDCTTLTKQYEVLNNWIKTIPLTDVLVLAGDFNRNLHEPRDSIRKRFFSQRTRTVELLPGQEHRSCWQSKDYQFDWDALKQSARFNNPEFGKLGVRPWIYHPKNNNTVDYFVVLGLPKGVPAASEQVSLRGHYRFEAPFTTLTECDGSMRITGKNRRSTLVFGQAFPSDRCPIVLTLGTQ